MNAINTLETKLADLYAQLPHLPANGRRWIANNAWWIVLILAIITTVALLFAIPAIFAIAGLSAYTSIYAYSVVPTSLLVTSAAISLAFSVVSAVLLWVAIGPLKALTRRGWKLLFINELVGVASALVGFIVLIRNFNLFSLIWALVLIAVELYFLFEVRAEFGTPAKSGKARAAKAVEAEVIAPKKKSAK